MICLEVFGQVKGEVEVGFNVRKWLICKLIVH